MLGEFEVALSYLENKLTKELLSKDIEVVRIYLAKVFLDCFSDFKISKKKYKKEMALKLLEKGLKPKDIAKITGLGVSTIWNYKAKM